MSFFSFKNTAQPLGVTNFANQGLRRSAVRFGSTNAGKIVPNPLMSFQDVEDSLSATNTARQSGWVYSVILKIPYCDFEKMLMTAQVTKEDALCENAAWEVMRPDETEYRPYAVRGEPVFAQDFIVIYLTKTKLRRDRTRGR